MGSLLRPCGRPRLLLARPCHLLVVWSLLCGPLNHAFSPSPPSEAALRRFKRLQNYSDLRGVSLASPGKEATFTPEEAFCLGKAFGWHLTSPEGPVSDIAAGKEKSTPSWCVAVGRDSRVTGPALSEAVLRGLQAVPGITAVDVELCSTPGMFQTCLPPPLGIQALGAVMVTASHLPEDRNGLKLLTSSGAISRAAVSNIVTLAAKFYEEAAEAGTGSHAFLRKESKAPQRLNFLQVYSSNLAQFIRKELKPVTSAGNQERPLTGYKVVVNAGNGAGGFFDGVLTSVGADTKGSLYLDPDGRFPNHPANPEDPRSMEATAKAVLEQKADLGLVFDTDVDRCGLVGPDGRALNRNRLIAMAAALVLRDHPGTTIVTDSVTSNGLTRFIQRRGGEHLRYKKGYKNVIDKARELNDEQGHDCALAIECSGHAAFRENYFQDDGAYLAVRLLIEMVRAGHGKRLDDLIVDLEEPAEYRELRFEVQGEEGSDGDLSDVAERMYEAFRRFVDQTEGWEMEKVNYEGLRAIVHEGEGKCGWVHVRPSLHDPIISMTMESEMAGGIRAMVKALASPGGLMDAVGPVLEWSAFTECLQG